MTCIHHNYYKEGVKCALIRNPHRLCTKFNPFLIGICFVWSDRKVVILIWKVLSVHFLQEAGVHFEVRGKSEVYYGTVAVFSADNLGSLLLGGFKESCSAEKCCRHCLATRTTSKQKVHN